MRLPSGCHQRRLGMSTMRCPITRRRGTDAATTRCTGATSRTTRSDWAPRRTWTIAAARDLGRWRHTGDHSDACEEPPSTQVYCLVTCLHARHWHAYDIAQRPRMSSSLTLVGSLSPCCVTFTLPTPLAFGLRQCQHSRKHSCFAGKPTEASGQGTASCMILPGTCEVHTQRL